MSVDADYARAAAALNAPRPAYVAYTQHVRGHAFVDFDKTARIVVRTSDNEVVHGMAVDVGSVSERPFEPACYRATAEHGEHRDGRDVLVFDLVSSGAAHGCAGRGDADFRTLVADAHSLRPLAATGHKDESHARAVIGETFLDVRGMTVPAGLTVDVDGDGPAFWLHIHVVESDGAYAFYERDPGERG